MKLSDFVSRAAALVCLLSWGAVSLVIGVTALGLSLFIEDRPVER